MYVEARSPTASHSVHGNNATVMDGMLDHVQKQDWLSHIFASPTSGEAYRDRRLTTNFEL